MIEAFSPDEAQCLIDYARWKFKEERFPFSPELRGVREAIAKPAPAPAPEPKPYVPSLAAQRKKKGR